MPILFAIIARGVTPLAKCATCPGNFMDVVDQLLPRISEQRDNKITYAHGEYLFHYVVESGLVYLCITDDLFDRSLAFAFLGAVSRRFSSVYGFRSNTALPYAMNSEFAPLMATEMRRFSESRTKYDQAQSDLDDLKEIMVKNIDSIASRGERLELLVSKAENLSANSVTFRANSRNLSRQLWWKNVKFMALCIAAFILFLYVIISFACGGLAWGKCV